MANAAWLIVGHGTRDPEGRAQFQELVAQVRAARPGEQVESGFLELQPPDIAQALDELAARGVTQIRLVPALLFAAGHARRDLPEAIDAARRRHPQLTIVQQDVLGCHPRLLALSAQRFDEALAGGAPGDSAATLLLLVGRGSLDPTATAELYRFARLRSELRPVGRCDVAFLAMAEPRVEPALAAVAEAGFPRVVVQPHLLFQGELSRRLAELVEQARREAPAIDWRLAEVLGPQAAVCWAPETGSPAPSASS